jgi:drug/metabolite transporter superfamily protein YnfA
MGRVQNTFYFLGTLMQLVFSFVVGTVSHNRGLAQGFAIVGGIYLLACLTGSWPVRDVVTEPAGQLEQGSDRPSSRNRVAN